MVAAARLVRAARKVGTKKGLFFVLFGAIFAGSTGTLAEFDLLPDWPLEKAVAVAEGAVSPLVDPSATLPVAPEDAVRIAIPEIGLDAHISNPISVDIGILDAALLTGAVHYPTSAKLGENGNVVLFGHSSYLPVVHNQAYKTFDGIQNLKVGETIIVYSASHTYTYSVASVSKVKAEEGVIPLQVSGRVLTLSTCDSFGVTSDRFVVTAVFVESLPVSRAGNAK